MSTTTARACMHWRVSVSVSGNAALQDADRRREVKPSVGRLHASMKFALAFWSMPRSKYLHSHITVVNAESVATQSAPRATCNVQRCESHEDVDVGVSRIALEHKLVVLDRLARLPLEELEVPYSRQRSNVELS